MTAKWQALLKRVPELPVGSCMFGPGKGSSTCLLPGQQLPASTSNSENADLCAPQFPRGSAFATHGRCRCADAVHPYRVVGLYDNRSLGITTYINRKNKGETGWSEDFMDAALLGMNESAAGAIAHANVAPFAGYRWVGFQAGIGAGGPITDHGGVATAGLRYM